MSALTDFRDHCRKMAAAEHKPECPSLGPKSAPVWRVNYGDDGIASSMGYLGHTPPPPPCDGCNPAADRALFERLAGEVDEYLERPVGVDLFGEMSEMPTSEIPQQNKGILSTGGTHVARGLWENGSGPERCANTSNPGLDQHPSMTGSASRG